MCGSSERLFAFYFFLIVQLPICWWTADRKSPGALKRSIPETSTLTLVSHSKATPSSTLHTLLKRFWAAEAWRSSRVSTDRTLFWSAQEKHPLILALCSPRGLTQPSILACRNECLSWTQHPGVVHRGQAVALPCPQALPWLPGCLPLQAPGADHKGGLAAGEKPGKIEKLKQKFYPHSPPIQGPAKLSLYHLHPAHQDCKPSRLRRWLPHQYSLRRSWRKFIYFSELLQLIGNICYKYLYARNIPIYWAASAGIPTLSFLDRFCQRHLYCQRKNTIRLTGQMQSLNCLCSFSHKVVTYVVLSQLWKIFSSSRLAFNCFSAVKQVKEFWEHCSLMMPSSILNLIQFKHMQLTFYICVEINVNILH